jgi:hypothetical protein
MTQKPYVMPSGEELAECFAQETEEKWCFSPISINLIKSFQQQDLYLIRKEKSNDPTYTISPFCGGALICHNNKIVIPLQLRTHIVKWYHKMLCRPGERCTEEIIRQHLTWAG